MPPQNFQSNGCLPGQPQNPIQIQKTSSPTDMVTSDAPNDFRACTCRRPTSLRQPDVFRASQPGPTSMLHPGDFLAPGRLPNVCSTEPNFRCRINDWISSSPLESCGFLCSPVCSSPQDSHRTGIPVDSDRTPVQSSPKILYGLPYK